MRWPRWGLPQQKPAAFYVRGPEPPQGLFIVRRSPDVGNDNSAAGFQDPEAFDDGFSAISLRGMLWIARLETKKSKVASGNGSASRSPVRIWTRSLTPSNEAWRQIACFVWPNGDRFVAPGNRAPQRLGTIRCGYIRNSRIANEFYAIAAVFTNTKRLSCNWIGLVRVNPQLLDGGGGLLFVELA